VIGTIGLVQLANQLIEPRRQDDEIPGRLRPGVPERMRDTRGYEHGRARSGNVLSVGKAEAERSGYHVPGLVITVVHMKGRDLL
jgi:hypothetical protein